MSESYQIVFSFDTTGSMYKYLAEVKTKLREIVTDLKENIGAIQIAIFAHGDYCDAGSSYVTKWVDFTDNADELCNFVTNVGKTKGGDAPECYELVMREVQEELSWSQESNKAFVLIGDSEPHKKDEEQNTRHLDWKVETEQLRDREIKVYAVHCSPSKVSEYFYQYISARTFGYYTSLTEMRDVSDKLKEICFREAGIDNTSNPMDTLSIPLSIPYTSVNKNSMYEECDSMYEECDEEFLMECERCATLKPPDEFPNEPVSENCTHYPADCLRCVVEYAKKGQCPFKACAEHIDPESDQVKIFEETLNRKFLDYSQVYESNRRRLLSSKDSNMIMISSMNGDTVIVPFNSHMTVPELKETIREETGIEVAKQKLLFDVTPLQMYKADGKQFELADYGITRHTSLSLIVPLYTIPDELDHVVFRLSWHYPKDNPDFLDASCLAFSNTEFIQVIDWNHPQNGFYLNDAVKHTTENKVTPDGRIGQELDVYLKKLPENISHLFFVLSSWKAPNLAAFSNPKLQFFDASQPEADLCGTTFSHAIQHQAVIMCYIAKVESKWQLYEIGLDGCTVGNAKRYNPIRQKIVELLRKL